MRVRNAYGGFLSHIDKSNYASIDYYSLGIIPDFNQLKGINLKTFIIQEAPLVQPELYKQLPILTQHFEKVYLHNINGDGYSLKNVDRNKLYKFYSPEPFNYVIDELWGNKNRSKKIVIINGKHKPKGAGSELYSKRIEAIAELSKNNMIDLYGHGWERLITRTSLWLPYIKNYRRIMSVYHGKCESKYNKLSEYNFCLCFENSIVEGYLTEKLFDCLYTGAIPIYLGAPDIEQYIPREAYIDFRQFSSYSELESFVRALSEDQILAMRTAGRAFIESAVFSKYYIDFLPKTVFLLNTEPVN